jgi:Xaa-Pro dipeptidase
MELLRAGTSFRDYSARARTIPERFVANRYYVSVHGCGMTGEHPQLYHSMDFEKSGYDGVLEPGMTSASRATPAKRGATKASSSSSNC